MPITGRVRFKFQTEILNAFNHPTFFGSTGAGGIQGITSGLAAAGFGRMDQTGTSRRIEFRANIEF